MRGVVPSGLAAILLCGSARAESPPRAAASPAGDGSGAPAASAWGRRPLAIGGSVGVATPVGLVGVWLDAAPVPWLSLSAGLGRNWEGLQLAGLLRLRFTPTRARSLYVGAGYSRGPFTQRRGTRFGALGLAHETYLRVTTDDPPPPTRAWTVAHWVNLELGAEERHRGGFDARGFVGVALLTNPSANRTEGPGALDVVPILAYVGAVFGYAP